MIDMKEESAPATPSANYVRVYAKSDGLLYWKDDAGVEYTVTFPASQAEMEAASSTTVAVTPGRAKYHPGVAKAWCRFNGNGTPSITAQYNVASLTDVGVGDWKTNFTVAFSGSGVHAGVASVEGGGPYIASPYHVSASFTEVYSFNTAGAAADNQMCTVDFGDQ